MGVNIFLIRGALPLLNCIEAKNRFHKNEKNILICIISNIKNEKNFLQLIKNKEWSEVYSLDTKNFFGKVFFFYKANKLLKKFSSINILYFGLGGKIIHYFVNRLVNKAKLVFVDEGSSTLLLAKSLALGDLSLYTGCSIYQKIKNYIFNTGFKNIESASLFTIYKDVTTFGLKNPIIINDYRELRGQIKKLPYIEKDLYFIGNISLSVHSRHLLEKYFNYVSRFFGENRKKYYILHRLEREHVLEELLNKYNFTMLRFDSIIEVEFFKLGWRPECIATFGSTAMNTVRTLYNPKECTVFEILDKDMVATDLERQSAQAFYQNCRLENIPVIRFE